MRNQAIIACLLLAVIVAGCDSFTDLNPISQRNKAEYYDRPQDFEVAINGAYDALQQDGTFARNWVLFEMRSDNTDQGPDVTGLARALAVINDFQESTTSEIVQNAWTASYEGIERANIILDRLEDMDTFPAQERIRGEALFIRALLYYHLAVAYGNITLKTGPTTSPDEEVNQVPASEVYEQIAADLEEAQSLLPARYGSENIGKATSGAANALLGKVYLTMGDPSGAETALRRVVNSGEYQLLDDYAELWGPENENNAESIFEVQFVAGGAGEGSPFTNTFSPSSDLQTGEGLAENRPTEDMLNAYEPGDARFEASMDTSYIDAAGERQSARFITKFESDPFANLDADNNWVVLRYADVLLMLAEAIGPSDEAWDLIDQVRDRADLQPVTRTNFYERLLHERRVELAFENHRWADLKRFEQYGLSAQDELADELSNLSGFNLLFPIPQREIDVAPEVMEQNPGYSGS